VICP
jgi:hypothetical protein